jgi:(E)-2-((N-methylformamido)methylene)succinate hydrolase
MSDGALEPRLYCGQTAYRDDGTGEAIIFLHGVGLNGDAWGPQHEFFCKTHRVISVDLLGHGATPEVANVTSLSAYVEQVSQLMAQLKISKVNIIGHSMGGLIAIGFALAHPQKTLRLGVLNSVFQRSAEQRQAVENRAQQMLQTSTPVDVETPLTRWFGSEVKYSDLASRVGGWLRTANVSGYATAYNLFARGDDLFVGKLNQLKMPALFATGSADLNSSPAMSAAMASDVQNGMALTIENARHMMNLTHVEETNAALQNLLNQKPTFDTKDLRNAFGTFMTGVTIVTTKDEENHLRGFTANSFSSVSLNPPLLLICISKTAASYDVFVRTKYFAVNILAETQKETSGIFASKRPDKFADQSYSISPHGNPILTGSVAWFDCSQHSVVDAGDHVILIGEVQDYAHTDEPPLGYARGGYFTLSLEQSALNAAAKTNTTEVGAILECDGKLLVIPAANGTYELPHVGLKGEAASTTRLLQTLSNIGVAAKLGFLFAVYENRDDHTQSIYYRGEAETSGNAQLLNFDDLDWQKFRDNATRAMLQRYCSERLQGRYNIYAGDHISGAVRAISS